MTKKAVHQLRAGDDLGGTVLISDPIFIGNYLGQKDRMQVSVRYASGKESVRIWGRNTTVNVK